ncbi:hypothetical protein BDV59DRAFT_186031 [Aspergillus ambiguus]|uniref:uncharacterized protein n=1 Tax=Aspergillus ambiguus TaxID=176160 RepID=UPI003CCDD7E5
MCVGARTCPRLVSGTLPFAWCTCGSLRTPNWQPKAKFPEVISFTSRKSPHQMRSDGLAVYLAPGNSRPLS